MNQRDLMEWLDSVFHPVGGVVDVHVEIQSNPFTETYAADGEMHHRKAFGRSHVEMRIRVEVRDLGELERFVRGRRARPVPAGVAEAPVQPTPAQRKRKMAMEMALPPVETAEEAWPKAAAKEKADKAAAKAALGMRFHDGPDTE